MAECEQESPQCCGFVMDYADAFGCRIWRCCYRPHHPLIFESLSSGRRIAETPDSWVEKNLGR